jgi:hypothetical protein
MREVFREASFAKGAKGVLFSAREVFKNTSLIDLVLSMAAFIQGSFSKNRGVLSFKTFNNKKENGFQVPFLFALQKLLKLDMEAGSTVMVLKTRGH